MQKHYYKNVKKGKIQRLKKSNSKELMNNKI